MTVSSDACAANHRRLPVPDEERLSAVRAAGTDVAAMFKPRLYQSAYHEWLGTVDTAPYRPREGRVSYYWPDAVWEHSFGAFDAGARPVSIGEVG
ncbi:hypothetical protein [Streptacidiphilus anmyonensis]|uniref:hypothetical protein n=1 Tax=Streptacidiphilus anmyonensis TaxID=405782 RepID=UPI00069332FD|nr:hypothetical protein [Streptacidiphilus anmyonensis]